MEIYKKCDAGRVRALPMQHGREVVIAPPPRNEVGHPLLSGYLLNADN